MICVLENALNRLNKQSLLAIKLHVLATFAFEQYYSYIILYCDDDDIPNSIHSAYEASKVYIDKFYKVL